MGGQRHGSDPLGQAALDATLIGAEDPVFAGGSYVIVQKYLHDLRGWNAVPEAEQCGWLADEFGVAWQIVPVNMGEYMTGPDAYQAMMGMKKIIIADFA